MTLRSIIYLAVRTMKSYIFWILNQSKFQLNHELHPERMVPKDFENLGFEWSLVRLLVTHKIHLPPQTCYCSQLQGNNNQIEELHLWQPYDDF